MLTNSKDVRNVGMMFYKKCKRQIQRRITCLRSSVVGCEKTFLLALKHHFSCHHFHSLFACLMCFFAYLPLSYAGNQGAGDIKEPQSSNQGASRFLAFPIKDHTPYDLNQIISVFDHSPQHGTVEAFNGERGESQYGSDWSASSGYMQEGGKEFYLDGIYRGVNGTFKSIEGKYKGKSFGGKAYLNYDGHRGVDIDASKGTEVRAAADGYVVYAGLDNVKGQPAGIYVRLQDDALGYQTQYLHLKEVKVSVSIDPDKSVLIKKGELIGLSGDTGPDGTPAHLHFEVKKKITSMEDGKMKEEWVSVDPYGHNGDMGDEILWADAKKVGSQDELLVRIPARKYHKGYTFTAKDKADYEHWMCCGGQMAILEAWMAFVDAGNKPNEANLIKKYSIGDFLKANPGVVPSYLKTVPKCPSGGSYCFDFSGKLVLFCSIVTHLGFEKSTHNPSEPDNSKIRINEKTPDEEPTEKKVSDTPATSKSTTAGTKLCKQNLVKFQKAWSRWRMAEGYDNPERKNPSVKPAMENLKEFESGLLLLQCPDMGKYDMGTADTPPWCTIHGK